MNILKVVAGGAVLLLVLFLGMSAAHEYSGHPIKEGTQKCADIKIARVCIGEVQY